MQIMIWQLVDEIADELRIGKMFGNLAAIRALVHERKYEPIAVFEIANTENRSNEEILERVWELAQNGMPDNWLANAAFTLTEKSTVPSASVGDIFSIDNVKYVVNNCGFAPL